MLYKNTLRKIRKSVGRFVSLLVIVLVGVGFYAGVGESAPDVIQVADRYFKEYRLMDFKIVSTMGLTDDDVTALSHIDGVTAVIPSYSLDVQGNGTAVRMHAIEETVNQVQLLDGRLPASDTECLADSRQYALGDTIEITDDAEDRIKHTRFTVVGLVDSVLYLNNEYGSTAVGTGQLSAFLFVPRANFTVEAYTELYIIADTQDAEAYSSAYNNRSKAVHDALTKIKSEREDARYAELYSRATATIAEHMAALNAEWTGAEAEVPGGEAKQPDIEHPKWHISDRSAVVGYDVLDSSIQVVAIVAAVLPLFFILISALMTSNSMARMVAEERGELGTLTSLGYKNRSIIWTYIIYVLTATWLGAAAGFLIGCRFIPPLVYSNFTVRLPPLVLTYSMTKLAGIVAIASVLMMAVTLVACNRALRENPASLMRPLPPKHGQRIVLERIAPIWRRLSFTQKVTMRNLFRYKKRALMTVIGVSGCTALLVTAFGLRDGMVGAAQAQYGDILRYDSMLILNDETTETGGAIEALLAAEQIARPLLIKHSAYQCERDGTALDCYVVVPEDDELFETYYHLNSTLDRRSINLIDSGIVVTQRIAGVYRLKRGDTLTVLDADHNRFSLTISDVAENYTSNYIYMHPTVYAEVFGEAATFNAVVSGYGADETAVAERLIDSGLVVNVTFTRDAEQSVHDSIQKLNGVIVLIIVVASLLAVVVLYNLTAINISERTREIATLKVLGFRDGETSTYIYREAVILTLLSICLGLFLGVALHRYVTDIIEAGVLSLASKIEWTSFALSGAFTMIFAAVMQVITHFKLKQIDMIESLKSVE